MEFVKRFALTGQTQSLSNVFPTMQVIGGVNHYQLGVVAGVSVPGDYGADGTNATAGVFKGGRFVGANFSNAVEELSLSVDGGDTISIKFIADLSDIGSALAVIKKGLGTAATVTANGAGGITISSTSVGASSTVRLKESTGAVVLIKVFGTDSRFAVSGNVTLGPPRSKIEREIDGRNATAGTYIADRAPHTGRMLPVKLGIADWTANWNFSMSEQKLGLDIDNKTYNVKLDSNINNPADTVGVLNNALKGIATAQLVQGGFYDGTIVITSSTVGSSSSVRVNPTVSSEKARMTFAKPIDTQFIAVLRLAKLSTYLREGFPDSESFVVYAAEAQTGFLIAESVEEGIANPDGSRKCASEANHPLIKSAAQLLGSLSADYVITKLDATHSVQMKTLKLLGSDELGPDVHWKIVLIQTIECAVGQELGQSNTTVKCLACSGNTVSADGRQCVSCASGLIPNQENSACIMCPELFYFDVDIKQCKPCEAPLVPSATREACICPHGTYNNSKPLACYRSDFAPTEEEEEESASPSGFQCHSCDGLDECLSSCTGDEFAVKPGWSAQPTSTVLPIFRCQMDIACPGGTVTPTNNTACARGYLEPICGACDDKFQLKSDGSCESCATGQTWLPVVVTLAGIIFVGFLATHTKLWYHLCS